VSPFNHKKKAVCFVEQPSFTIFYVDPYIRRGLHNEAPFGVLSQRTSSSRILKFWVLEVPPILTTGWLIFKVSIQPVPV